MEIILCFLALAIPMGILFYFFYAKPQQKNIALMDAEAKREGEERALRVIAREMGMSLETFEALSEWALDNRESPDRWPFAPNYKGRKTPEVELATLDEILRRHGDKPEAAIMAIYRGAKLTTDEDLRRRWNKVVKEHE